MKYLGINLTKYVQDLQPGEKNKTPMKNSSKINGLIQFSCISEYCYEVNLWIQHNPNDFC